MADWQAVKEAAEAAIVEIAATQRPQQISYDGHSGTLFSIEDAERLIAVAERMLAREADDAAPEGAISYADT